MAGGATWKYVSRPESGEKGWELTARDGSVILFASEEGKVIVHKDLHLIASKNINGEGTGSNGIVLKNLKNAAASALSGTQLDVEIDIGGTSYHFTVYPTKA